MFIHCNLIIYYISYTTIFDRMKSVITWLMLDSYYLYFPHYHTSYSVITLFQNEPQNYNEVPVYIIEIKFMIWVNIDIVL